MNDQEIRYYLLGYITEEMKVLDERELAGYGHEFSKRFHRKMKKIFWSEKYFGKHLHLAYAVRKIAAVVAIVAGLLREPGKCENIWHQSVEVHHLVCVGVQDGIQILQRTG